METSYLSDVVAGEERADAFYMLLAASLFAKAADEIAAHPEQYQSIVASNEDLAAMRSHDDLSLFESLAEDLACDEYGIDAIDDQEELVAFVWDYYEAWRDGLRA